MVWLRRTLIAGLLVWLPLVATIFVLRFLVELMDVSLRLLPHAYQPDTLVGFHIPGLGVLFTLVILLVTGLLVRNFLGRHLMGLWDALISRIPLVRSIYAAVKQVLHSIFSSSGQSFRQVVLLEYPKAGLWSLAFLTGKACQAIEDETGEPMLSLFVPTTPNPTSGFLILAPKEKVKPLSISVDEALKMVISLGVVQPGNVFKTDHHF